MANNNLTALNNKGKKYKKELTPQQLKFAEEYLRTNNGTQSALRAGYNKNSAGQQASRLLKHPQIQEYFNSRLVESKAATDLERSDLEQKLWDIIQGKTGGRSDTAIIRAIEVLAKMKGFNDVQDSNENNTLHPISIKMTSDSV